MTQPDDEPKISVSKRKLIDAADRFCHDEARWLKEQKIDGAKAYRSFGLLLSFIDDLFRKEGK